MEIAAFFILIFAVNLSKKTGFKQTIFVITFFCLILKGVFKHKIVWLCRSREEVYNKILQIIALIDKVKVKKKYNYDN